MLSRSIEVILQEELVDSVKPGDRVSIIGVFRPVEIGSTRASGMFKSIVLATSLKTLNPVGESLLTP